MPYTVSVGRIASPPEIRWRESDSRRWSDWPWDGTGVVLDTGRVSMRILQAPGNWGEVSWIGSGAFEGAEW
jgi:hypothetical protein